MLSDSWAGAFGADEKKLILDLHPPRDSLNIQLKDERLDVDPVFK